MTSLGAPLPPRWGSALLKSTELTAGAGRRLRAFLFSSSSTLNTTDRSRVARAAWGGGVCALGLLCGVSGVCGRRVSIVTPEPTPERWSRPGASSGTAAGVAPSLCTFGPKVNSVSGPAQSCPMEIGYKPPNGSTKRATERGEDEFSAASCLTHDVQTHHPIAHLLPARFLETHLQHISVGLVAAAGKWGQVLVPLLSWSLCSCQRRQTINLKCVSG